MAKNTLGFLLSVVKLLEEAGLSVWIFGGWAEELWRITPERIHSDIDFLYSAPTFEHLDRLIAQTNDFHEISAKRFSHKRAILYQHVMIEFLLVRSARGNHFTDFFSGQYHLEWPADLFSHKVNLSGYNIQVASKQALTSYRQHHKQVEEAYQEFSLLANGAVQGARIDEDGRTTSKHTEASARSCHSQSISRRN